MGLDYPPVCVPVRAAGRSCSGRAAAGGHRHSAVSPRGDIGAESHPPHEPQSAAALPRCSLPAHASTAAAAVQCVEIMPCLDKLPQLLGKPYGLEDEEAEQQLQEDQQEQAGGNAMEVDGTAAATRPRPDGCHTTEELLQLVQVRRRMQDAWLPPPLRCAATATTTATLTHQRNTSNTQASRAELAAELQRLQAVQLGPYWRLLDAAYLGSLLEMLVVRCAVGLVCLGSSGPATAVQPHAFGPRHCCGASFEASAATAAAAAHVLHAAAWSAAGTCASPSPCRTQWRRCSRRGEPGRRPAREHTS
jgi:hypothetical protein